MKKVSIYTDGSCLNNPGPGGWAAILTLEGSEHRREISGGYRLTTNNRMEILAAAKGLQALNQPCEVSLYTDSKYLRDAVEKKWLASWQKNSWRKADRKPVLNVDLWKLLLEAMRPHAVEVRWIKGHAGHPANERCDQLAKERAGQPDLPPDENYENQDAS